MDETSIYLIFSVLLVFVGLSGIVVPALPGILLLYGGLFLAAWAEHFEYVGRYTLIVLAVLAAIAYLVDFLAGVLGAKYTGASKLAIIGAALGMFFGMFLGLPGMLLGPFVGAVAGEYWARRDLSQAGLAGIGTWLGLLVGVAVKVAISFAMLAIFLVARFT